MTHFKITTTRENAHQKNQCGRSKAAAVIISLGREEFARMSRLLPEEREALEFFSHLDLTVRHIPSGPRKSPEFFVVGDGRGYVVEVKARRDSKEWERSLRAGDAAYQVRTTGFGRWAEDITRKAMRQMQPADPDHARFWVLWLSIECKDPRSALDM